jgi:hypothetical protein
VEHFYNHPEDGGSNLYCIATLRDVAWRFEFVKRQLYGIVRVIS